MQTTKPKLTIQSSSESQWDSKKKGALCLRLQKHFCNLFFFLSRREDLYFNGIHILGIKPTYLALLLVTPLRFWFSKCVFFTNCNTKSQWCYILVILDEQMHDVPVTRLRATLMNSQLHFESKKLRFKRNGSNFWTRSDDFCIVWTITYIIFSVKYMINYYNIHRIFD